MRNENQKNKPKNCKELIKKGDLTFYDFLHIIEDYTGIKLFWWQKIYLYTTCYKQWQQYKGEKQWMKK